MIIVENKYKKNKTDTLNEHIMNNNSVQVHYENIEPTQLNI